MTKTSLDIFVQSIKDDYPSLFEHCELHFNNVNGYIYTNSRHDIEVVAYMSQKVFYHNPKTGDQLYSMYSSRKRKNFKVYLRKLKEHIYTNPDVVAFIHL